MDLISIKRPNPKCLLSWCLIEFIYWRYSQSCWYFRPLLWTSASLTFSLVHLPPPPLPCVNKYMGHSVCIHTVCNKRGGGMGSGPQTDKHLPPSTFTGQFVRKPTFRVWRLYRYLVHDTKNWKWEEKPYLKVVLFVYICILVVAGVQRVAQHLSQLVLLPAPPHPHSLNRARISKLEPKNRFRQAM